MHFSYAMQRGKCIAHLHIYSHKVNDRLVQVYFKERLSLTGMHCSIGDDGNEDTGGSGRHAHW
jgi:hypothetical protein